MSDVTKSCRGEKPTQSARQTSPIRFNLTAYEKVTDVSDSTLQLKCKGPPLVDFRYSIKGEYSQLWEVVMKSPFHF